MMQAYFTPQVDFFPMRLKVNICFCICLPQVGFFRFGHGGRITAR